MAVEAPMRVKLLAGLGLVCVTTLVGLLYKVSQATAGGFQYSTTSAIAIAEMLKLAMSVSFHFVDRSHRKDGLSPIETALSSARHELSRPAVLQIWLLAALYSFNNQLSFFVYRLADPGTIYLFKAASTLVTATIQCTFARKVFTKEQWKAMFLQGVGMVIVQYNPCKGATMYQPRAYLLMALSAAVTAVCAARNEYLVKNYKICLNVQNAVLYAGGSWMNVFAFCFFPNPNSKQAGIGFFEGYTNVLAVGVICVNAVIGLAITAVYKYADAITKCIATDITAVLLCIISSIFFGLRGSLTMWCGVVVVCFAVHLYANASVAGAAATAGPPAAAPSKGTRAADEAIGSNGATPNGEAEAQEDSELKREDPTPHLDGVKEQEEVQSLMPSSSARQMELQLRSTVEDTDTRGSADDLEPTPIFGKRTEA